MHSGNGGANTTQQRTQFISSGFCANQSSYATRALPAMVRVPPAFMKDVSDWMQGTMIQLFAHHVLCACNVSTLKISHLISFTGPILAWFPLYGQGASIVSHLFRAVKMVRHLDTISARAQYRHPLVSRVSRLWGKILNRWKHVLG